MQKNITNIRIGPLWNQGGGATMKDELETTPDLGPDAILTKPLTGDFMLIRMKEGLTVLLQNIQTETELECTRCLDKFKYHLHVSSAERQFYESIPERDYDPFEIFLINMQEMSIDLTEMLRQEIILNFPMIPVCSERCKGLCPGCRINLNTTSQHLPDCTANAGELIETSADQKHFAHLKDLFKK